VRIVSRETLQSTCLRDDRIWDLRSFNLQKVHKTVDRLADFAMNQRITAGDANVFADACSECRELCCWIFSFIGEEQLERDPSIYNFFGKLVFSDLAFICSFVSKKRPVYTDWS
jgi:hypothetical protein